LRRHLEDVAGLWSALRAALRGWATLWWLAALLGLLTRLLRHQLLAGDSGLHIHATNGQLAGMLAMRQDKVFGRQVGGFFSANVLDSHVTTIGFVHDVALLATLLSHIVSIMASLADSVLDVGVFNVLVVAARQDVSQVLMHIGDGG